MRPSLPILKLILLLCALALAAFAALNLMLPRLIDLNSYQAQLTDLLRRELNRPVSMGESQISWTLGPVFTFRDLAIGESPGRGATPAEPFLTAREVSFRLSLLPLLRKRISLNEIDIRQPVIRLSRDREGKLSIDDLLKPPPTPEQEKPALRLHGLKLQGGTLIWRDAAAIPDRELAITLSALDLSLDRLAPGRKSTVKLKAQLGDKGEETIALSGSIRLPKTGASPLTTTLNTTLKLSRLDYDRFWPYVGHLIPFPSPGGRSSLELTFKGTWDDLAAKGELLLHQPRLLWPTVFPYPVMPQQARLVFDLKRTPDLLDLPKLQLTLDGFAFRGSVNLSQLRSGDPLLRARGSSDQFDYVTTRSYIPFGIIEDDVADFIRNKIKSGRFKLINGTLDARFSQLVNFGKGDNANTLFIHGTAEDAVISYGPKVPSFNRIHTTLELKGRNFNLPDGRGHFGDSPFTVNGTITEYATDGVPCAYPFIMDITPKPSEVAWLARFVQLDTLSFSGPSSLRLTGAGLIRAYQLSGAWNLTSAAYELAPAVKKPAGMANNLSFSSILSKHETRLSSISYSLPPLQLSASGLFRHDSGPPHLSFELQSNAFFLGPKLPILTAWQQYQPQGTVQVHLLGDGNPEDFGSMQYNGTIRLTNASVKPLEGFDPVRAINGTVTFKGNSVQTSRIAVQYGSTPLTVRGRIVNLAQPEAELLISSPRVNLKDFGLTGMELPPVRQFSTHLVFRDQTLGIRALTARLEKSVINADGRYTTAPTPSLFLNIAAPRLDIEELLPLFSISRPAGSPATGKQTAPLLLAGRITAEQGSYRDITFTKLAANVQSDGGVLQLHSLEAGLFDGTLAANGQLVLHRDRSPDWALALRLSRAKSGELFAALDLDREIRGRITVAGNLKASGSTLAQLKQSAYGDLKLDMERGVLRRFNSLSKVFSILNLSQLLSFRLPDMASDGMPFNRITASVALKNGILTTRDFFIDSNAMHISMVGTLNVVKEEMDLLIGVQPLQTVDKIISRIPVVGWILTGGDSNLISAYFEAKGSWADPKVAAIPAKSMAKGTLGIFQRIFELPVRLFTDTGEVLIGVGEKKEEDTDTGNKTGQPDRQTP